MHAGETCVDVVETMVFTVMLMVTMTSHIAKQCFEKCSDCIEVSPPRDTFWRRVIVCCDSGFWTFAFADAPGLRWRSALPVRREVLDRMTAQRLDRKRLLRASIFAVKLWQDERVPEALSCLAHVE